jgi:hypothetical protein
MLKQSRPRAQGRASASASAPATVVASGADRVAGVRGDRRDGVGGAGGCAQIPLEHRHKILVPLDELDRP